MTYVRLLLICLLAWQALAHEAPANNQLSRLSTEALSANSAVALSPSGKLAAIEDSIGGIWIGDAASGSGKQVTKAGAGKVTFTWSPDDKFVWVAREGKAASFHTPGGHVRSILDGVAPLSSLEVSPDARTTAFIRNNNLWLLSDRAMKPLTKQGSDNLLVGVPDPIYAREFDVQRHLWWSPDSSSIAFIETEFPSSDHYILPGAKLPIFRLKIADTATGQVTIVSESSEEWPYLMRVTWHPDSKRIAFYRMNRLQTSAELCLYDGATTKTILTEKDAYWVNVPETPLFVNRGNQVVVSSERSGNRHVYLYELGGDLVRDLTPGDLEVYKLHHAVDEKGGVFVSASNANRQERQLFRLDTAGGARRQITGNPGWHDVTLTPSGNAYFDRFSSVLKPTSVWWHGAGSTRELVPPHITQKAVTNEYLSIETHDHIQLPARLFKPDDFLPQKKYPVILYTFSGPKGRVVADEWGGWQMAWNRYMVARGYLVLAVDVRGSGGYGHLFEEYIHYRFGAQEVADLREVVSYLRRLHYVDGARLGIWGCDYGAHTVVHAMLQFPGGFKAGFADSPIVEWTSYNAYFAERYLGLPARRISEYDDSTALDDAHRLTGTLLVVASDQNQWIRPSHIEALQKAFAELKRNKDAVKRLKVVNLPDADYRDRPSELANLMQRMTDFFSAAL